MDCLEFRNQYLAFVDQTLPLAEQSAAAMHLATNNNRMEINF